MMIIPSLLRKYFFLLIIGTSLLHGADFSSLAVRGHAVLSLPADQLVISIGVVSQGKSAQMALSENNTQMKKLIDALQASGIKEGEYQTGRFSIRPLYSQRPKGANNE